MTRRNDRDLAVAKRDTWTITAIDPDGTLSVQGDGRTGSRTLPAAYVHKQVELAYATTVHGAQGETTKPATSSWASTPPPPRRTSR